MPSTTTPPTSGERADAADGTPGAAPDPIVPPLDDAELAEPPRLLLFRAGGRLLGCPLDAAREVLVGGAQTRLPGAPPHVLGLRNVRGRLVTVLDVARLTGGAAGATAAAEPAPGQLLLVDGGDGRVAGCRVDAVLRVVPVPALDPAPAGERAAVGNPGVGAIVLGVGQVEGEPVTVLDLPRCVRATLIDLGER